MTGDLVTLEIRFLVARYGVGPVLKALAKVRQQTPEQVEAELERFESSKAVRKRKPEKAPGELLARLWAQNPEQVGLIRELVGLYEQKRFLPNLRVTEEFVAQRTREHPRFKSRKSALPVLVEAMAAISSEDLRRIRDECAYAASPGDYELLAGAILGAR